MRIPIVLSVFAAVALVAVQASRSLDAQALASPTYTAAQAASGKDV